MRPNKIVIHEGIMEHRKNSDLSSIETRLDYVSLELTCGVILPIYYYSHNQVCQTGLNDCEMHLGNIKDIDDDIISQKIEEVSAMGFEIKEVNLVDNLHTHPIGYKVFSPRDYAGILKPDYNFPVVSGSNMIFGFDGEFYKALFRRAEDEDSYEYTELEPITMSSFEPYYDVDQEHFKKKENNIIKKD